MVFDAANGNGDKVVPVSTADYYASAEGLIAPRPVHSALDLSKLEETGFHMPDWEEEPGGVSQGSLDPLCYMACLFFDQLNLPRTIIS